MTQKRCSHEGCTKQARTGGVCATLGAVAKCCNNEGCTKHPRREEFVKALSNDVCHQNPEDSAEQLKSVEEEGYEAMAIGG